MDLTVMSPVASRLETWSVRTLNLPQDALAPTLRGGSALRRQKGA